MRKMIRCFLCLIMVLLSFLPSLQIVYAKEVVLDRDTSMSTYVKVKAYTDNLGAYHEEQGKRVFKIDNQYAYCIESNVGLSDDKIYQDGTTAQDILSSQRNQVTTWQQKYDMLSVLLAFVPTKIQSQQRKEHIQWLVGQVMVWEITGEERKASFVYAGVTQKDATAYRDVYEWVNDEDEDYFWEYYHQIEEKILKYWKVPSFMSKNSGESSMTLDHYDGTFYYQEFIDAHQVLDQYDFSANQCEIEVNHDRLLIKTKVPSSVTLTATLKPLYQVKAPLFWTDGHYQKTMTASLQHTANYKAYANVDIGKGRLKIVKYDDQKTPLANTIFEIVSPNQEVRRETTNSHGEIVLNQIESGLYQIKEVTATDGYIINEKTFSIHVYPSQTATQTIVNDEPLGTITLHKSIDGSSQYVGDAYLRGNEYSLYAKEDITNRSKSHIYYHKDDLICRKVTNDVGEIIFDQLYLGEYYIKETKANDSLILNQEIYSISLSYKDMYTAYIHENIDVKNEYNSQRIRIFKQGESDSQAGVIKGIKGAEFTFVLNNDYQKYGFEKSPIYFQGETDENGFLVTSLLPYGIYYVRETKTPLGYYGAADFLITVTKNHTDYPEGYQIQHITVNNRPFESLLKIVKRDSETKQIVKYSPATFKIKDLKTQQYISYKDYSLPSQIVDQWTTNEDGTIILNTYLKEGQYQLEEIKAPFGYTIAKEPVIFTVTAKESEKFENGNIPIITIDMLNDPVKGQIKIEKKGEVLVGFENQQFVYEKIGLSHAIFGIYAKENIVSPCDGTILFKKGQYVEKLETLQDGCIMSSLLPLGKYEVKELKAPYGYLLCQDSQEVDLSYQGELKDIVFENISFFNERQKMSIDVEKRDAKDFSLLKNVQFSLYANADIYNINGDIIVNKGTLLQSQKTNDNGRIYFDIDLPLAQDDQDQFYILKETKQLDGYILESKDNFIDARYQEKEHELFFSYKLLNQKTQTYIYKVDENKRPLKNALLQIIDPVTQTVLYEWTTTQDVFCIEGLIVGKPYILHEVQAPLGYQIAKDIEFVVTDSSQDIYMQDIHIPVVTLGDEPPVKTADTLGTYNYCVWILLCLAVMLSMKMETK